MHRWPTTGPVAVGPASSRLLRTRARHGSGGYCRCYGYRGTIHRLPRPTRAQRPRPIGHGHKGSALPLFRRADRSSPEDLDREPLSRDRNELITLWRGVLHRANCSSPEDPPPREGTSHVTVMHAPLCALTKTRQHCRVPLAKVSLLVYKARPTAAPTKAPPKTSLFGERGPGRHNPTKETSFAAPRRRQDCGAVSLVDQDHEE